MLLLTIGSLPHRMGWLVQRKNMVSYSPHTHTHTGDSPDGGVGVVAWGVRLGDSSNAKVLDITGPNRMKGRSGSLPEQTNRWPINMAARCAT